MTILVVCAVDQPALNTLEDEQLVAQICNGNRQAFRVVAERHGLRFRALAYRFVGDIAQAEDIVQEAFVKLWAHASRFDGSKAKFTTWFHRIVVNRCLDEKRKRQLDPLPDDYDEADSTDRADAQLETEASKERIKQVLSALSERQRTAITLSYFSGLSNQEAAEVMDLNIKAYESLLVRSRTKMRKMLMAEKADLLAAFG